mmetsp:Transcript_54869/g.119547  ORF Transcript_54869/g.119547 Transcript_54869/m.119547 type:complete len:93 (-) Transcript_54869:251-529(-)
MKTAQTSVLLDDKVDSILIISRQLQYSNDNKSNFNSANPTNFDSANTKLINKVYEQILHIHEKLDQKDDLNTLKLDSFDRYRQGGDAEESFV